MNKRKLVALALCAMLFALCFSVQAQQPAKIPRIGFLASGSASGSTANLEIFRQGLRELGYIEGKNISIEDRWAEGKLDRLPELAAELVSLGVDIIVTGGTPPVLAAKKATNTIPIVAANADNLVELGVVASLARPGGNVTGSTRVGADFSAKRLELLKESFPKLSRVAVLGTSTIRTHARFLKDHEPAAGALGINLQFLDVLDPKDIETAFRAARKGRADGLLVLSGNVLNSHRTQVLDLAVESRLPAIYNFPEFVEAGGLMTYGVNLTDLARRAATYVDKILKGAKPADLPVEQPKKFELIINLKTAKQIGLTIPPNVLVRATKVIK